MSDLELYDKLNLKYSESVNCGARRTLIEESKTDALELICVSLNFIFVRFTTL